MTVHDWSDQPVEELGPGLGRQLLNGERLTVARILLAAGTVVPEHSHDHEQVANVLEGRMRFRVGGEAVDVGAGESLLVRSNVPHSAEALEDSVVLDVFAPVRDDWARGDDAYLRGGGA